MNAMKKLLSSIRQALVTSLLTFVGMLIPLHAKRILLLTTVYKQLADEKILKEMDLDDLNKELHLATSTDALKFPYELSSYFWRDVKFKDMLSVKQAIANTETDVLSYNDAKSLSRRIVSEKTPMWLRYADNDTMSSEVLRLFFAQTAA